MTYANFTRPLWGWLSEPGKPSTYFGQPLDSIPSLTGHQLVEAHLAFAASFPWRTRLGNMNALDTHDIPRFAQNAREGAVPVAFGMAVTFVGVPVIWAGDEFGLRGEDGEASRTPLPWGTTDATAAVALDSYRSLVRLRRDHIALNEGGMRWLHIADDVLVYVREHAAESVLCVASRAGYRVRMPLDALLGAGAALRLHGDGKLVVHESVEEDEGAVEVSADGISVTVWRLPGVAAPHFKPAL